VAALAVLAVNEIAFQLADRALDNVQARHNARNEGLKLRELLTDAETAQRGYLLTGRDDYLAPCSWPRASCPRAAAPAQPVRQLRREALVAEASRRTDEKLSELQLVVSEYRDGSTTAWRVLMESDIGREKMQAVREAVEQLDRHELAQIVIERDAVYRRCCWAAWACWA
jgi:CHASE3 domain sensor protein